MPIWVRFFFTLIFYFFIFFFYLKIKNQNKKKWNLGLSERKEREKERERKKKSGERMSLHSCSKNFFSSFFLLFSSFFFFFSPRHLKNKMKRETGAVTNPFCSFFFLLLFYNSFCKTKTLQTKVFFVFFGRWKKVSVFFEKVFLCWKEFKVLCDQKEKTKAVLFGLKSYSKALSRKQSSLKNNNYYPHI